MANPAPHTLTPGTSRRICGEPLARHQATLTTSGWDVRVLPGLDHIGAMHSAVVLPLLSDWLRKAGWAK